MANTEQGQTGKYPLNEEIRRKTENEFTYHAPKGDQQDRYGVLREKAKELAYMIHSNTPKSREQSVALTKLESAVFYANAAIARNE